MARILWVDDEIDMLKPHILFLEERGHAIDTATNGDDALDMLEEKHYDLLFLDEHMPGKTGLETLSSIKEEMYSRLPVVMITKSEEDYIMEDAIGAKIADYLIKPVKPIQLLSSIKKVLQGKRLVADKTTTDYQSQFSQIGMQINDTFTWEEWIELYQKLTFWELEMDEIDKNAMLEVLEMQKKEANNAFVKFIEKNYLSWFQKDRPERPMMSHDLIRERIVPLLKKNESVLMIVIDNWRYDQWQAVQGVIEQNNLVVATDDIYYSILPTTTGYARNAIFSGLLPSQIEKLHPDWWVGDFDDGRKNEFEDQLLQAQLKRYGLNIPLFYKKIFNRHMGDSIRDRFSEWNRNQMVVLVYNVVDMISHAYTEIDILKELVPDEAAYRKLTSSWFVRSSLPSIIEMAVEANRRVVITTDHGCLSVKRPVKVTGDRFTSTNLRYKQARSAEYDPKDFYVLEKPSEAYLPQHNISSKFIFTRGRDYIVYPNNFNRYVQMYENTFQHGGISLEEILVPYIELKAK